MSTEGGLLLSRAGTLEKTGTPSFCRQNGLHDITLKVGKFVQHAEPPSCVHNVDVFTPENLSEHNVWDCYAQVESPMTIADLLASYRQSNEYAEEDGKVSYPYAHPYTKRISESQRLYGKDLIFPSEWQPQIETLPNCVLPFQEGDAFAMMNPAVCHTQTYSSKTRPNSMHLMLGST